MLMPRSEASVLFLVQLLQAALSVHPDKVEKTVDDIMTLKKINPDTNPQ